MFISPKVKSKAHGFVVFLFCFVFVSICGGHKSSKVRGATIEL